jgi:hypothetical protein
MLARPRALRAALGIAVALGGAAGCLLVTPLDDLPAAPSSSSHGGQSAAGSSHGGATSGTNSVDGGSAGEGAATMIAGTGDGSGQCSSNAECVKDNADRPARCRPSDHKCVTLINEACPVAYGDASNPNAVYFGAFATLNPNMPEDNSIIWAHELARAELSGKNVGGLPDSSNTRHPLVMIVCNNAGDVVGPGLQHLAEDVQVPAIIATLKPDDLRTAFETNQKKHDIFYLSPVSVTSTVVEETDHGLIWNLLGQPSDMAPTYAELLKLVEKRLRKDRKLLPTDQLKVALVTTKDAFDSELGDAVAPLLSFNGKSATDNLDNYYPVTLDAADPQLEHGAIDIATYRPDVIISTASELFSMDGGLQEQIEDQWGQPAGNKPRPFYILSPYNAGDLNQIMKRMNDLIEFGAEADPQLRQVGVSIAAARDNTLQNAYALRLKTMFKKAYADTANYYDAVYYLAYAMYAADPGKELTGSGIAQGMQRLLSGNDVNIGPPPIAATFKALSTAGSSVHLVSTLGPPDFNAETGVRPVDGGVLCFGKMGNSVELHTDVLRYDPDKQALTGTFPCFEQFFP